GRAHRLRGAAGVAASVANAAVRCGRRRLFLRAVRFDGISQQALSRRLVAGEDITSVDLRTRLEVEATPVAIPGSRWMSIDEIDEHGWEFMRSRELVLYCS